MMTFSNLEQARDEARKRLPLKQVLEQRGFGPGSGGSWKGFKCPFCASDAAGVFERGGREWFKCHHVPCESGNKAMDEAGFLAAKLGWTNHEAFLTWLREAGVELKREAKHRSATPKSKSKAKRTDDGDDDFQPGPVQGSIEPTMAEPDLVEPAMQAPQGPPAEAQSDAPTGPSEADAPSAGVVPATADGALLEVNDGQSGIVSAPEDGAHGGVGGGGTSDGSDGEEADSGDGMSPLAALRAFYEAAAPLSAERMAEMEAKRGLTKETVEWAGLKVSCKENRDVLEKMRSVFDVGALVRAGLYTAKPGMALSEASPNAQLCGYGFIRKKRDSSGKKMDEWETGWIDPILIPYFDEKGDLVHLRPHKGMQKDERVRLFVARPCRAWIEKHGGLSGDDAVKEASNGIEMVVVTEGEFKALALAQTLNDLGSGKYAYQAAALPGITNAKNWFVWEPLRDWLEDLQPKSVVVAYDSEEKGDPKLPGYTANRWDRYESIVWARYLIEKLAAESHETKLAFIPKEWRDANGKADWDGALARLISESGKSGADARRYCRSEFLKVLKRALPSHEFQQLTLLGNDEAFIVEKRLRHVSYEPQLPYGSFNEKRVMMKLRKLVREQRRRMKIVKAGAKLVGRDGHIMSRGALTTLVQLAEAYKVVEGCYYTLREPVFREKGSPEAHTQQNWIARFSEAKLAGDEEAAWACSMALKGFPEQASDFFIRPYFILRRSNGTQDRYVKLYGVHGGRTDVIPWDAKSFAHPRDYRVWLANQKGGYAWFCGEKELEKLQTDTNAATAGKMVNEVPFFGHHKDSGLWLFDDCAYGPDGKCLMPDKYGSIWHLQEGYRVGDRDLEEQEFALGRPKMRPGLVLKQNQDDYTFYSEDGNSELQDPKVVREFFGEYESRLFATLGGYDAWLVIGGTVCYAAMPEIFAEYSGCGGLWFHGETQQGKSSVARWQTHWFGFQRDDGVNIRKMTDVGLAITLNQYANLPVWLEEFKRDIPDSKQEAIKCAYNREGGPKWAPGGQRRVRTVPVITGESTSLDAATRSRYPHVLVSSTRRSKGLDGKAVNWFPWFQRHRKLFFVFGREVMRHREAFARAVLKYTEEFRSAPGLSSVEHRAAMVYGNAYASFLALEEVFGGPLYPKDRIEQFKNHCVTECMGAVEEVKNRVNVEVFLQEIVSAFQRDAFGSTMDELARFFYVSRTPLECAPGCPDQEDWANYRLYIAPGPVFGVLREQLRREGRSLALEPGDTKAQMAQRPYFVPGAHVKRFGSTTVRAWCIDLDECHEFGYTPQTTDDVVKAKTEAMERPSLNGQKVLYRQLDEWEWDDPRKGPLYGIVERLMQRQRHD